MVGTSSRLDAEYSAVRQDKGGRPTRPWIGGVVEAVSPWAGATPRGDLYASDAMDLFAKVGAPHKGGAGLVLRRCKLRLGEGFVRH